MSRKRRAVVKKLTPTKLFERRISETNKRLKSLNKAGFKSGTWASKKLIDRLSSGKVNVIDKKGKVSLKGGIKKSQRKLIDKAITNFLRSETSTPTGIESVRERTIKSLAKTMGDYDKPLSYDDAETLYNMLGDKDFNFFSDKYTASEVWALIETSIEENDSESDFLVRFGVHLTEINDDDLLEKASRLYEKFVI